MLRVCYTLCDNISVHQHLCTIQRLHNATRLPAVTFVMVPTVVQSTMTAIIVISVVLRFT
jgi:hypothetical protein